LLSSHRLKPSALEEFIKKYEDQDESESEAGMPLYSLNYDYENKLEDAFSKAPEGWIRTDMFKDYEERGRVFMEIVNKLESVK
jgi:hypothetical protein